MRRVLALDFDGVISNSAPEAFVVALRTFVLLRSGSSLRTLASAGEGDAAPDLETVESHPVYGSFLELMPLGNRAEDYGVCLSAIEAGRSLPDQDAYDAYRSGFDADWMRAYHARFYEVRAALCAADPIRWQRLMRPYQPFLDVLRRRAADAALCVATAKDRGSVRRLLRAYGVDELFPEDCVLDKEAGVSKSAHLVHLQQKFGCRFDAMTFVDDKVTHLDDVARLGVRCALAGWGFNAERERALARAAGHLVCDLGDVEAQLFG